MKINQTYKLFAFFIFLFLAVVSFFITKALTSQKEVIRSEEHRYRSIMLAIELFQSSEDLTRMARTYVSTGDTIYRNTYFEILDIRNGIKPRPKKYDITYWHLFDKGKEEGVAAGETAALRDLMQKEGLTEQELGLLQESQANSDRLVKLEKQAFAALNGLYIDGKDNFSIRRKPDQKYALGLLTGKEYSDAKARIMAPIRQCMEILDQRTKAELTDLQSELQLYILLALSSIAVVMVVVIIKFNHTFKKILFPIKHLSNQVSEIEAGNYSARYDIVSGNEIGDLCRKFNSMADSLQNDIEEREKAEAALKESEEKFKTIFEHSSSALALIEKDTTISMVNQEYCKISGYKKNEVIGMSWTKQIPPKDLGRLQEYNRKRLTDPKSVPDSYEIMFYRKDGEIRDALMSVAFIPTNQKIICSFTDITERKKIEDKLRESQQKFQGLVETLYDWIWEVDPDGRYTYVSPQIMNILGYDPTEILGKTPFDLMLPEEKERVQENFEQLIKRQKPIESLENINLHKDGHQVILETNGLPFYDSNGNFKGYRGTDRDITHRRLAEYKLGERLKELRAFYHLSEITEKEGITLENLLQEFVEILPQSWQYDKICFAGISIGNKKFRTKNYSETDWITSSPIKVNSKTEGRVEVGYLEEKPEEDEGPFLKEERQLLNSIAERLGHLVERFETEEELRKKSRAIEQNPASIVITDTSGAIEYVNPKFIDIAGYSFREVLGKNPRILKSGETPAEEYKKLWEAITSGNEWRGEFHNKKKNGELYWESAVISPLKNAQGIITHFIAIKEDITERKSAEAALRKSSDTIQLLLNSTAEAIYGLDMNGLCTFNNAACLKILDYERSEQLTGKNMHDLIHYKHADGTPYNVHECPIFKAFHQGTKEHIDNEVLWRADGTSFAAEYWSYPIQQEGKTVGAVVTFLDITDRKHAEYELKKSTEAREILITELQAALNNVKTLQGLIPICANCKKIRDDQGYWNQVEGYLMDHTDAKFSHGLCPDCGKKLYGDLYDNAVKRDEERKVDQKKLK